MMETVLEGCKLIDRFTEIVQSHWSKWKHNQLNSIQFQFQVIRSYERVAIMLIYLIAVNSIICMKIQKKRRKTAFARLVHVKGTCFLFLKILYVCLVSTKRIVWPLCCKIYLNRFCNVLTQFVYSSWKIFLHFLLFFSPFAKPIDFWFQ